MAKWKKPSGAEIVTNDLPATVEHAEKLGWKRLDKKKKAATPKAKTIMEKIKPAKAKKKIKKKD